MQEAEAAAKAEAEAKAKRDAEAARIKAAEAKLKSAMPMAFQLADPTKLEPAIGEAKTDGLRPAIKPQ